MKQLNLFGFPDKPGPYEASPQDERTAWWLPLLRGPRVLWDDTGSESVPARSTAPAHPRLFPDQ
jgi:hypothetical protein